MILLKQQLKLNRASFAQNKNVLKQLCPLSNSCSVTRKHKKKFQKLIDKLKVPYRNPYDSIKNFDISSPTFTGIINQPKPVIREAINVVKNTVINLTDEALTEDDKNLLPLGLKFCPTIEPDLVTKTSTKLEPVLKKLGHGTESAAVHNVASSLLNNKQKPSNMNTKQKMALKSLKKKSKDVKIVPADKGNAAVIMTNSQYLQKMEEHLNTSTYSLLKKNPTDSLSRKLDNVLKKLLNEGKISKKFHDDSRVLHPRTPQLYGLPKIHKPGNPLRSIVSFYDTPLSALHKQLSEVLKPLTVSDIRIKNSEDFLAKFSSYVDLNYPYYCSLDVKSLYTTCDMGKAVDTAINQLYNNPNILPPGLTPEGIKSLLNFSLDNAYCVFNNHYYKEIIGGGGAMGSPLIVTLAQIHVTDVELRAIASSIRKPKNYYHFVDDGFGHFIDREHAKEFMEHLNSIASDLEYTIEHPSPNGVIPFLDIVIHPDTSTSI